MVYMSLKILASNVRGRKDYPKFRNTGGCLGWLESLKINVTFYRAHDLLFTGRILYVVAIPRYVYIDLLVKKCNFFPFNDQE